MYIISKIVIFIIHFYSLLYAVDVRWMVLLNCLLLLVLFVILNTPFAL